MTGPDSQQDLRAQPCTHRHVGTGAASDLRTDETKGLLDRNFTTLGSRLHLYLRISRGVLRNVHRTGDTHRRRMRSP